MFGDKPPKLMPPLWRSAVHYAVGVFFDVLFVGIPALATIVLLGTAIGYLLEALKIRRADPRDARARLMRGGVAFVFSLACVAGFMFNSWMGRHNAEKIVSAVEAFRTERGRYPADLAELVPAHYSTIPRACIRFNACEYRYWNRGDAPQLMWVALPPFGRPGYDFKHRVWMHLD